MKKFLILSLSLLFLIPFEASAEFSGGKKFMSAKMFIKAT